MKHTALVVAAHPDDEVLGAGGSLALLAEQGYEVYALIMSSGVLSRDGASEDDIKKRLAELDGAAQALGIRETKTLDFPDNAFDSVPLLQIVKAVEQHIAQIQPSIVFTHHGGDVNVDHQLTFKAVMTACRPCNTNCPQKIYTFETPSSTEWQLDEKEGFIPNTFVDISSVLEKKLSALKAYQSELCQYPHSRSLKGVEVFAQFRGLQAGMSYAEGLRLVRSLGGM